MLSTFSFLYKKDKKLSFYFCWNPASNSLIKNIELKAYFLLSLDILLYDAFSKIYQF